MNLCNNYITRTNYDGGVKNSAVHLDFRWRRIPRTVDRRAGTTQAASLLRLVGVARALLEASGQIGLKPVLHT